MNKHYGGLSAILFAAALATGLAGGPAGTARAEDALAAVKSAGVLKVGTETEFAPFDYIDAGKHAGLNVDLFDEIGKELGVKIEWIALPWDGVLPGLDSGKFDIVAGPATITKKRMERYRFSPPIAEATVAILKKAGDDSITKPEDIAGKPTGSGKATAQLAQLQAFVKTLPEQARSRNMSASTRPMPISPPAASWPSPTRCPTSPSWPSRSRTCSRSCCRPSARSPISASRRTRTRITRP